MFCGIGRLTALFLLPSLVAGAAQVPLVVEHGAASWTHPPDADSPANDLFNELNFALEQWSNTIFRTGHTLFPATVPAGTILYHGRFLAVPPADTFEWLAFDFEHSYLFNAGNNMSHVYKYAANRDLKLLYLDGVSAGNHISAMQMQDVLIYGEVPDPERDSQEWPRAQALCEWGAPLGLDGFVRMEFHFEIIYCNFSTGLTLLEHLKPLPKSFEGDKHPETIPPEWLPQPLPGWSGEFPHVDAVFAQAMVAGSWHAHAPGETRVRAHLNRAVSFYDPDLTSLRAARRGQPRTHHRLTNISRVDAQAKVAEIEGVVKDWLASENAGSGADWASTLRQVEERHSARLLELNHTLHAGDAFDNSSVHAAHARQLVLIMLAPYMAAADFADAAPNATTWLHPAMARCSSHPTVGLRFALAADSFTKQEKAILDAVEGTQREICRVLGLVWLDAMGVESGSESAAARLIVHWRRLVDELLAWLDWASFRLCRPGCAADERCYVSTWPFIFPEDDRNDLSFQPRCVSLQGVRGPKWSTPGRLQNASLEFIHGRRSRHLLGL